EEAGIKHADVDHLMIYDAFAHLPLYGLEDLGFCKPGEAAAFTRERNTAIGGKLPLNTNGGGLSYMHSGMYGMYALQDGVRRFRGWSGGAKARFTLTETWATPSYLPGPLPAGAWKLILGVPNLRKDGRAEYVATITLDHDPVFHGFVEAPLKAGPGWYRGDLHMHTEHSDGSCQSRSGRRVP